MKYQPPYDPALGGVRQANGTFNANADAAYVNGDPATGTPGSIPPDDAFEHPQREIVAAIVAAGLTPDHTVLTQLRQAIARSASGATWFACAGSANAYTLTATDAFDVPTSPFAGQVVRLVPNHTNTGAATATWAGVTRAIRTWNDAALIGGTLVLGRPVDCVYVPTANGGAGALLLMPWCVDNSSLIAQIVFVVDQKAHNAHGGSFSNGAWRTRDLNTIKADPFGLVAAGLVSVSSNQVVLGPGVWWIEASAPAVSVNTHVTQLYNVTAAAEIALGDAAETEGNQGVDIMCTRSHVKGLVTVAPGATAAIELRHRCQLSMGTWGFGYPASAAGVTTNSIYSTLVARRISS